jgi:sterol desaturase/sphingolipid hydroxylase (fatty acid hydroxylase superfamily)
MDHQTPVEVVDYLVRHVTKAFTAFLQHDSVLYWPYLLSTLAIVIAVAIFAAHARAAPEKRAWWRHLREYFTREVWWHPSARADYRLYFANALLLPALFGLLLFGDLYIANLLNHALGLEPIAAPRRDAPPGSVAARIAFTIAFFIAYDFGRFVAHTLLHDVPLLWEFHKVHHSAETLNPMTTFRAHPVDLLVMAWVPLVMTGLVTWGFNQLTGSPVRFYTYLGLHVVLVAGNLVGTLRHTNVWLSYGPVLNRWLISPAQHQLHHSCEPQHVGCNRGFELAIWDRIYGTLYVPQRQESFRMGLGDGTDGQWHTVRRLWVWPFVNAWKMLVRSIGSARPTRRPG